MSKRFLLGIIITIIILYGGYHLIKGPAPSDYQQSAAIQVDNGEEAGGNGDQAGVFRTQTTTEQEAEQETAATAFKQNSSSEDSEPDTSTDIEGQDFLPGENIGGGPFEDHGKSGHAAAVDQVSSVNRQDKPASIKQQDPIPDSSKGSRPQSRTTEPARNTDSSNSQQKNKSDAARQDPSEAGERVEESVQRVSMLDKVREHVVKKGETLWGISHKYGIDIDTIIGTNDITNMNRIKPGDKITILPVKGILYKINPGESLWTISKQFNISTNRIVEANNIADPDLVKPGTMLILPGAKPEFGYQERLQQKLMLPVHARISSPFGMRWGRMHEGIDLAVNVGTSVRAAAAGRVIYSGWASGYGNTVIIEHRKGLRTLYAHNSRLLVHSGERVNRGEVISKSGNTGNSTGPHLHFEVQINGKPVNPLSYAH